MKTICAAELCTIWDRGDIGRKTFVGKLFKVILEKYSKIYSIALRSTEIYHYKRSIHVGKIALVIIIIVIIQNSWIVKNSCIMRSGTVGLWSTTY